MSLEENKAIMRRWMEGTSKHDLSIMDELLADDYVLHGAGGQDIKGPEGFKQAFIAYLSIFPDIHFTIDDMVAEGDKVAVRVTMTGTHKGEFMGIAPTGKQIATKEAIFYRLAGGKIVEGLPYSDSLVMFQQLGVNPPGQ